MTDEEIEGSGLEERDASKFVRVLSSIGASGVKLPIGHPTTPEGLTETLSQILGVNPGMRRKLAESLIDIALHGMKDSDRLDAIKEIYDRIEGKSRTRTDARQAEGDPLLRLLNRAIAAQKKLPSGPSLNAVDGEVREITDDE
jgi:hypothetical protein